MEIKHIILHEVNRDEETSLITKNFRESQNEVNDNTIKLSTRLSELFSKTGLQWGGFKKSESGRPIKEFEILLEDNFSITEGFSNFLNFSKEASKIFARKLNTTGSSKGGYLWFNCYSEGNNDYLTIVLLRKRDALKIADDLTLDTVEQIDLEKLHMAAKINLSQWREDRKKYIAFKIGRDATNVTNYFSDFIGCESITEAKIDTDTLISACTRLGNEIHLTNEQKIELKHFVYDTISEWDKSGQQISLSSLSTMIDTKWQLSDLQRGLFLRITQQMELDDLLNIDKSILRKLRRYSGKSNKIRINFDNDALDDIVHYNREDKSLKIDEIPRDLLSQLEEE